MTTYTSTLRQTRFSLACWVIGGFFIYALIGTIGVLWQASIGSDWDGNRLARALSVSYGYFLYYPAKAGPITGFIYPPLAPLFFLPARFAGSPTATVIVAQSLGMLLAFAPGLLLAFGQKSWRHRHWIIRWAQLALFALIMWNLQPLTDSSAHIHVDSIMLGLAGLACVWLHRLPLQGRAGVVGVAAAMVGSVGCKLATLPLLPLIFMATVRWYGWRVLWSLVLYSLVCIVGVVLLARAFSFQPDAAIFNLLTVPAHHPWTLDKTWMMGPGQTLHFIGSDPLSRFQGLMQVGRDAGTRYGWLLILASLMFFALSQRSNPSAGPDDRRLAGILLILSLLMIPSSLIGAVKVGGDLNNYSGSLYFSVLAMVVLFPWWIERVQKISGGFFARKWQSLVIIFFFAIMEFRSPEHLYKLFSTLQKNHVEEAYAFARAHPGEAYFPDTQLATLLAEHRLDHFIFGVRDRALAGFPVTSENFVQHIPPHVHWVVVDPDDEAWRPSEYPGPLHSVTLPELPEWNVYVCEP